ncbi:bifunctional folylpolyglutamate synthase/dihydrofolate synthase [Spiribacter onubensis]|uniref:Dihydrofolate synthase/folylpolyglutamate synthase n=1 Tax=Spiribacter onubensis TaxID=3122420 RepID=A0ABV3S6I2_9GAMM
MSTPSLDAWLAWLEGLHPREIELGLGRITEVADRLGLRAASAPIITVAGTNGKGSTVACLEAIYQAGGHRPGAYTSPHLLRYNERIRVDGAPVEDAAILEAFRAIDAARGRTTLTYFEFATLAAAWCFRESGADPWLLEVGLGGRLDATNCFNADLAVVTTIDLDHMEWLGDNREAIAGEKMGIARPARPVVCADARPPRRIAERASALDAPLWQLGRDYHYAADRQAWTWWQGERRYRDLPRPGWMGDAALANAAGAVMAVSGAHPALAVGPSAIRDGLAAARLAGRHAPAPGPGAGWLLDVGHNPSAIALLAERLEAHRANGKVRMAFGLMARKPIAPLLSLLGPVVDEWYVLDLDDPQSHPWTEITTALERAGQVVIGAGDAAGARQRMEAATSGNDLMVAAGSFRVVEAFMRIGVGACNGSGSGRN